MSRTAKLTRSRKLLLLLVSVALGAGLCEAGLRIFGYYAPLFYEPDYDRGYALRPGVQGRYDQEGESYVVINSQGLRDREHQIQKPVNAVRIAVLGDSFTEAMQVPLEQTFTSLLEQKLQDCNTFAGKQVEVINFGVSGYGTAQELITLRQRVWAYSPDIVLLVFTTYNDLSDNSRGIGKNEDIPYFVYRNGELVYDASFRNSPNYKKRTSALNRLGRSLNDHSRIVQLIYNAYVKARLRIGQWREGNAPYWMKGDIYLEPQDEKWRDAWQVTEELIKQMRSEVAEHGAKFLIVSDSNPIQVYPDSTVRQNFMDRIGLKTLFYPNHRLGEVTRAAGIDFMDLAEPMQAFADQNKTILHNTVGGIGNGHWNMAGHRLAAELISAKICRQ